MIGIIFAFAGCMLLICGVCAIGGASLQTFGNWLDDREVKKAQAYQAKRKAMKAQRQLKKA